MIDNLINIYAAIFFVAGFILSMRGLVTGQPRSGGSLS